MKRITLKPPPSDRIVELGGHEFKLLPLTKEVEAKLDGLEKGLEETRADENANGTDRIRAMAVQLDVMLEPLNGSKVLPSKIVVDSYEAGQATQLTVADLIAEAVAAGRPT